MNPPLSPAEAFAPAAGEPGAILLETQRPTPRERFSYLFRAPVRILEARSLDDVVPALAEAASRQASGCAVAGFLAYEAGYALDDVFRRGGFPLPKPPCPPAGGGFPLLWFGVYDRWRRYDHLAGRWRAEGAGDPAWAGTGGGVSFPPAFPHVAEPAFSLSPERHAEKVAAVREAIARGDVYQANLTGTFRFPFDGDPYALYLRLRAAQPVPFGAFLQTADGCVVSQSPELFFRVRGRRIVAMPMKGTAAPGTTDAADRAAARALARDPKNRAENVMIVDLLRNDLGRICGTGSVRATRLFEVQRFRTVLQMVSTIGGTLREGTDVPELFRALFPCGSITGAPKISAMRLLAALEETPRGIYTGAVGAMLPGGDAVFSVAIRTVAVRGGRAEAGAGGGIVWDSRAEDEYREILRKGRFLRADPPDFRLVETMGWRPEAGFQNLQAHLSRLSASARHFGFPANVRAIRRKLEEAVSRDGGGRPLRVRLLLDAGGGTSVETAAMPGAPDPSRPWRVRLSATRVYSSDPFLRHKTTRRAFYDAERAAALADGCDEVLFLNERGELTEGTITNVFLEIAGRLFTPPLRCGLLPGVGRRLLLADRSRGAGERILSAEDLRSAGRILLCNSLRGVVPAVLADPPGAPAGRQADR